MTEKHAYPICVPYTESVELVDSEIVDRLSEPAYQMFKKNQLKISDWEFDDLSDDINWMYIWVQVSTTEPRHTLLQLSGGIFV